MDYGEFDGRPLGAGARSELWTRWRSDPDFRPPVASPLAEAGTRVRSACDDSSPPTAKGHAAGAPVVVVSHVSPIKAATCWALGLADEGAWRLYLATASMTRIGRGAATGPLLNRFNQTPWSEPPARPRWPRGPVRAAPNRPQPGSAQEGS